MREQLGYEGTRLFQVLQNPNVPQGKVLKNSERNMELFNRTFDSSAHTKNPSKFPRPLLKCLLSALNFKAGQGGGGLLFVVTPFIVNGQPNCYTYTLSFSQKFDQGFFASNIIMVMCGIFNAFIHRKII